MLITELASTILKSETPKYAYDPFLVDLNDGVYIFRMSPFTTQNQQGGVWFPNVTIQDSYSNARTSKKLSVAIEIIESMIIQNTEIENINELVDATFSLLHEEGHWKYYYENYLIRSESGEKYMDDYNQISNEMGLHIVLQKAKQSDEFEEYHRLYRKHPFEKYADDYAIEAMRIIISKA
ncbi:hypothetical protein BC351_00580 [Paenibacillus ferrarius]|uniref:Uncharacterized protein n=1 Tax=Paenibacillus ferrarius TaxID=1469647 RepID=A0A1V4HS76_9BACL|nr:hypothetical protein [Paenibacillus ferrarius]OPH61770.1 hypothetical protein BC351_00580 [Paenibacillus ferrarius]